jgi:hypothetical protein
MPERRFLPAPLLGVSLLTAALCGSVLWGAAHAQDTAPAPQSAPATAQPAASSTETAPTQTAPSPSEAAPDINAPTAHERAGRCVEGPEQTCMDLARRSKDGEERRIMVIRTGSDDTTGIYALCTPQDDEPEDAPNVGVFSESGAGGIRIVIDKNLIQAPLAVVTQQAAKSDGEGEAAEGSDGRVEASSGTARFLDDVPEGQTDRLARGGGGRVSKAGRVEYDDQANTARLYATPEQPAESVRGNDVLRISSGVIVYNLEKNEVYTNAGEGGNITGEFQDEAAPDTSP